MFWLQVIWISIIVGVLGLGFAYLNMRLVSTMDLAPKWKMAMRVCLAAMILVPVIYIFGFRYMEIWGDALAWVAYVGLGFLSVLITALVVRDIAFFGAKGFGGLKNN
jgi:hypothetical protein